MSAAGVTRTHALFSCHVAPNGGWLLQAESPFRGEASTLIGAFSTSSDLVAFIDEHITDEGLMIGEKPPTDVQPIVGSRKP